MHSDDQQAHITASDPETRALDALGWILQDQDRATRFLDLTGLTPAGLRQAVTQADGLCAVLNFLAGHEPDLIACAAALGVAPTVLMQARDRLASADRAFGTDWGAF